MQQRFLLDKDLEDKITKITGVDYYGKLELKDITSVIEDLIYEYHNLEEKLEEQEEHCRWYHKPIEKDDDEDIYLHRREDNENK